MNNRSRTQGFSLIEVMVALIIIAVGMLGIAKMQALALSNTESSGVRSLVAIEAASLAGLDAYESRLLGWRATAGEFHGRRADHGPGHDQCHLH